MLTSHRAGSQRSSTQPTSSVIDRDSEHVIAIPTLTEIGDLARALLEQHNLTELGWTFAWDRAKRRLGSCNFASRRITLSRPIFTIEANRNEARPTILHEIAHALAGNCAGHGSTWQKIAIDIGASPTRCRSVISPELPIVGTCNCGTIHARVRKPSPNFTYTCRKCASSIVWLKRS